MAGGSRDRSRRSGATATTIADNVIGRGVGGEILTAGRRNPVDAGDGQHDRRERRRKRAPDRDRARKQQQQPDRERSPRDRSGLGHRDPRVRAAALERQHDRRRHGGGRERDLRQRRATRSRSSTAATPTTRSFATPAAATAASSSTSAATAPATSRPGPTAGSRRRRSRRATPTAVSGGGALPGAAIRVFRKATAQNGEIKGFLGKAEADGSGNWSLAYESPLPLGTEIGVTQTGPKGPPSWPRRPPPTRRRLRQRGRGRRRPGGRSNPAAGPDPARRRSPRAPKGKSTSRTARLQVQLERGGLDVPVQARPRPVQDLPLAEEAQEPEARQARLQGAGDRRRRQHRPDAGGEEVHAC